MVTKEMSAPNSTDSVVLTVDTATGYPEYFYFKKAKLLPAIQDNEDLYNRFVNVEMYHSKSDTTSNYEDLFNLTGPTGGDPEASSLFNIATLKELLAVGSSVKDVVAFPKTKSEDLDLSVFKELTETLKLDTNEQSYLLYLWLKYCKKYTFERADDTDDTTIGVLANIGQ